MIVKVCGMRNADNISAVDALGIDMMGFIFYPRSPRYAVSKPDYLPGCRRVGVFVDADVPRMLDVAKRWRLWGVQLHGSESADVCRALRERGLRVIKAFGVGSGLPAGLGAYEGTCDMYLFDTACKQHGGSGKKFDWKVLEAYQGATPFLLSGGIGPDSVDALNVFSHERWAGIDLNSAFELSPGLKDVARLSEFLKCLRKEHLPHIVEQPKH